MWRYIVRRLLWVVLVVLIITAFTFVIFFVMPPTDPAVQFAGKNPTPEQIAEVRRQFGLDKPVWQQYGLFLKNIFTGDEYGWPGLGFSFVTRSPVRDLFFDRMTRGNLIETMGQDYIRTARVKGLPEWKVILKHGVRASLTPVVTLIGLDLGALLGGAVITETVFNLQGIGQWAVNSVFQGDLPAVLAVTVIVALAVTLMNLIVDVVYAYLDPRVRYT